MIEQLCRRHMIHSIARVTVQHHEADALSAQRFEESLEVNGL